MKAIVYAQNGTPDVLQWKEVATPALGDDEVLIKLCAASVNILDLGVLKGVPPWVRLLVRLLFGARTPKPKVFGFDLAGRAEKVLGSDIAGRVEAVGKRVKGFQPGDEVFGGNLFAGGGFAEQVCAVEGTLALSQPTYRLRTQQPCQSRQSPPSRAFAIRDGSSEAKRFWLMARQVVWGHLRSRLPNRSELKSPPYAARGT